MIDCTNDVDLQLKMISNEGKIHVWYSWSTGSYLGVIVDLYTKWWSYPDQKRVKEKWGCQRIQNLLIYKSPSKNGPLPHRA